MAQTFLKLTHLGRRFRTSAFLCSPELTSIYTSGENNVRVAEVLCTAHQSTVTSIFGLGPSGRPQANRNG